MSSNTTLLNAVQDVCRRQGLPVPATVFGSTDAQVLQMMALLEEECNDLSSRHAWEALTIEVSHTTLALEDQGDVMSASAQVPGGVRYIKNGTIWDRSTKLPVCGPLDSQEWQQLKAINVTGPRYQYRIRGNHLLVNPVPPAGESWYYEVITQSWIEGGGRRFFADTNGIALPDDLVIQGLRWRWKKEKGFDYAEDFRTYEMQVKDAMGRDGGKRVLYMDGGARQPMPGIWVSPGSWNV